MNPMITGSIALARAILDEVDHDSDEFFFLNRIPSYVELLKEQLLSVRFFTGSAMRIAKL
jgi:hypothetical protein